MGELEILKRFSIRALCFKFCIHLSSIHALCISEALIEVISVTCTVAILCITERSAEIFKNLCLGPFSITFQWRFIYNIFIPQSTFYGKKLLFFS